MAININGVVYCSGEFATKTLDAASGKDLDKIASDNGMRRRHLWKGSTLETPEPDDSLRERILDACGLSDPEKTAHAQVIMEEVEPPPVVTSAPVNNGLKRFTINDSHATAGTMDPAQPPTIADFWRLVELGTESSANTSKSYAGGVGETVEVEPVKVRRLPNMDEAMACVHKGIGTITSASWAPDYYIGHHGVVVYLLSPATGFVIPPEEWCNPQSYYDAGVFLAKQITQQRVQAQPREYPFRPYGSLEEYFPAVKP